MTPPSSNLADRAAGCIVGAFVGDALGLGPHWYYDLEELRREFGEWIDGYTDPKPNAKYHRGMKAGELSQTGIVMLTTAAEVIDRVVGLEMGADDYLGKPFDMRELQARVTSVLRRRGVEPAPATAVPPGCTQFGRCTLNQSARKLFGADGAEIALTSMEFDLLCVLAENPNRVLSRDQLMEGAHHKVISRAHAAGSGMGRTWRVDQIETDSNSPAPKKGSRAIWASSAARSGRSRIIRLPRGWPASSSSGPPNRNRCCCIRAYSRCGTRSAARKVAVPGLSTQ